MNRFRLLIILITCLLTFNSQGEGFIATHNRDPKAIKLTVNARVMRYLHASVKRPYTRQKMRETLDRMNAYRPMIEAKLAAADLPKELLAVPAVESLYRNTAESPSSSGGLWQLLPQTARDLGLRVDRKHDDRFDAEKETDAAVAYLKYIYNQCGRDWMLTLLSYNAGETNVRRIVRKTKINDVFKLADTGQLANDENTNYVSKVMALMIVIDNPALVE